METGSWEVSPDQIDRLAVIADGTNRAIAANPSEVFLIEGHTDAVGSQVDNLSLSDRRAESVALVRDTPHGHPAVRSFRTLGRNFQKLLERRRRQ
jgi:flagellar motor protein MotB